MLCTGTNVTVQCAEHLYMAHLTILSTAHRLTIRTSERYDDNQMTGWVFKLLHMVDEICIM